MKPMFLYKGKESYGLSTSRLLTAKMRLTMKFTCLLLLVACLQTSAKSYAQKVTLSEKDAPLEKIFRAIRSQTGYLFLFDDQQLQQAKKVTIHVKDAAVQSVLEQCFREQPLSFSIVDKTIIVKPKEMKSSPQTAFSVRGTVTDNEGKPFDHVTVQVAGKGIGMTTNENGEYDLNGMNENDVLVFSFIGFATQKISINGRSIINVRLQPDQKVLDETVIIGYGTTTQRKSTGAISSITSKEIARQTIDNPLTALQGHIAGVQITQDNGLPGAGVRVQIRGQNTAAAGFIPLYVIDGVPFTLFNGGQPTTDALNAYGTSGANGNISPFSMINPEDIERIDVLKDADATAIYGSRGANGVILITTKKGSKGKTSVSVNVSNGIAKVNHFIPMMNTQQYLDMRKEAFANSGVTPTTTNAKDLTVWDQNAYTDWQKWAIGGTAHNTNASLSVSGGNAQNSFLFSTNYNKQGTVFPGEYNNNALSGRLNVGHKSLDNRFSMNVGVNYASRTNNLPQTDLSSAFYDLPPNFPLYNADSTLNWSRNNPIAYLRKKYNSQTSNFISSLDASYKILPNLTAKVNLGFTQTTLKQTILNPASSQNISATATPATIAAANNMTYSNNGNDNYIVEPQLEYTTSVKGGKLQLLGGATFQQNKATGVSLRGSNYSSETLLNSLASAGTVTTLYNNFSLYKYSAFFGRLNYSWQDKYIVDGTFRRDGSSRFGPDHRFGNFGAVGAAWLFSKETFMKHVPVISFGKLRGSYGLTGNDQISNYLYNALYSSAYSGYSYLGSSTLVQYNISNPNLHWETTKKLDIALELGFLNDRILFKTDFYRNRSSDQLISISLPSQGGFSSYTGNFPAVIENKGWEFELNTTNIESKNFKWTTSLNLTLNRNKLVSFPDLATSSYSNTYIIGQPIDVQLLYHYTGVNEATGLPTFATKGTTANYATDRIPMKVGTPYYGGLTNNISYKNFTLDFTFQFNHRYGFKNSTLALNYYPYGYTYTNQTTDITDRWKTTGDDAFYPAAGVNYDNAYSTLNGSDYNWGDASFIKFKTLSLTYSLPKKWLDRTHMSAASIYAQGQNLYTWAKQKYVYDPETTQPGTGSGLGTGRYAAFPQLRTMVVGLNLSF